MNVIFLSYAAMIPFFIFSIFFAFKPLKEWKSGMLSLYLLSFDEITTVAVVYSFFASGEHYLFGILQILFLISSNYFSGASNKLFGEEYENLRKWDKRMAYLGFGANYFKIKSWRETATKKAGIYTKLSQKHKIWAVMFEIFPSLALQIYASLVDANTELSVTLNASIILSCINITFTVWWYMVEITHITKSSESNRTAQELVELQLMKKHPVFSDSDILSSPESKTYISNHMTESIEYHRPSQADIDEEVVELPPGWRVAYTPDNKQYDQNQITKETQWKKPTWDKQGPTAPSMNAPKPMINKQSLDMESERVQSIRCEPINAIVLFHNKCHTICMILQS